MIGLDKKQIIIGGVIIAVIIGIIGYYFYTNLQTNEEEIIEIEQENKIEEKNQQEDIEEEQIIVHIAGEVKKPGIIKTKEGARIADIIEESTNSNENNIKATTENKKININKATQEELQTLQGIRRSNSTENN